MIIGFPKALEYYRNEILWTNFFAMLGIETICSGETTKQILQDGIRHSIDESCLSSKIYMGHVAQLLGKCDKILVPRLDSITKKEYACTKLNALCDIVSNVFDANFLCYNIDARNGYSEHKAFIKMGTSLGFSALHSNNAYLTAKENQIRAYAQKSYAQKRQLLTDKIKVLIVGHDYNVYDSLIGQPFINMLKELGTEVILACESNKPLCAKLSKALSSTLFWRYNKELIGTLELYGDKIDGAVYLATFPCGPDSLVNELMLRRCKDRFPSINLIIDEQQSQTGLYTRAESFFDLLNARKNIQSAQEKRGIV